MEVEFESPEQLNAFQCMKKKYPEEVERLLDQGAKLQARVAELEAKLNSARPHVHRQQHSKHEQDRIDANEWLANDRKGES